MSLKREDGYWKYMYPVSEIEKSINLDLRKALVTYREKGRQFKLSELKEELLSCKDIYQNIDETKFGKELHSILNVLESVDLVEKYVGTYKSRQYSPRLEISSEKTLKDALIEKIISRCNYKKLNYTPKHGILVMQIDTDDSFIIGRFNSQSSTLLPINGHVEKNYIMGNKIDCGTKKDIELATFVRALDKKDYYPLKMNELIYFLRHSGLYHSDKVGQYTPSNSAIDKDFFCEE